MEKCMDFVKQVAIIIGLIYGLAVVIFGGLVVSEWVCMDLLGGVQQP